jgi:hypothetical protein
MAVERKFGRMRKGGIKIGMRYGGCKLIRL